MSVKQEGNPNQVCPKCGEAFFCGAEAGGSHCWCFDLPPVGVEGFEGRGCLCPGCLREWARQHQKKESQT
ncbi:MAG: cysteine-rich CWC family protein [Candidatus Omnitrophica bacterium]|nr:cysteine-rich CWC family protein [Candidatus Omnitrophota bacterium]